MTHYLLKRMEGPGGKGAFCEWSAMNIFLEDGELFSGCRILRRCGQGAYGVVYLAENVIGQKIVMKLVPHTDSSDRELRGLRNYMRISGTHPNLLQVFHIGEMDDGFFYTMEAADNLASGDDYRPATLGNMLREGRKFSPEEAVAVTRELLGGMAAVHAAHLVHRDIKPDNIIFVNGKAKLSDPGLIAEDGSTMTLAGTPGFIPPEVLLSGKPADSRGDLYAIGKVFYCMVTGNSPSEYPLLPGDMRIEVRRQLLPALMQMCNNNPAKRFKSAEAFLHGMPEKIASPTRWEKFRSDFRDWKVLNREKYRRIVSGTVLAALVLLGCAAFFGVRAELRRRELAGLREKVNSFLRLHTPRKELLALQFEAFLPQKLEAYKKLLAPLEKDVSSGSWREAARQTDRLSDFLSGTAAANLPDIPAEKGEFKRDFDIDGAARSFLAAPLASFLPPAKRAAYMEKLKKHEDALFVGWLGPRCEGLWHKSEEFDLPLLFVPSGAVRMQYNGRTAKIPYHFWIGKNEISGGYFTRAMKISPQSSTDAKAPVERVAWNDMLFFCRLVTRRLDGEGKLPPGYIVRPPTEAEWEYAAQNAWLGKDTTPFEDRAVFKENSGGRSQPPGTRLPNRLGISDIYGNIAETVIPFEKPAMANSLVVRGGSFQCSQKNCFRRQRNLMYQWIPADIGFRVVVAPGDMSFFDENFFISGPTQAATRGKVYELIGGNLAAYTWSEAEKLCRLLGGRLAEIEDEKHLKFFDEKMPLAVSGGWPCFVNGRNIGGQWVWLRSKRKVDFGKWYPSRDGALGKYLTIRQKMWKSETDLRGPIFLCEWDEKDYPRRNDQLESGVKLPQTLARFSIGDKDYLLVNSSMLWNAAVRFCELMGGRMACPDTEECRKAVIEKLKDFSHLRIFLGGYRKFDKWYWLSGREIRETLPPTPPAMLPSVNRNFVILKNGKFYDSQISDAFLLEWRRTSSVSSI